MNQPRLIFKSKTHAFNLLISILIGLQGMEGVGQWVQGNAPLVAAIFYLLSNGLRRISHGKVALFPEDAGGYKLPLILVFGLACLSVSCQPALLRITTTAPTPRLLVSGDSKPVRIDGAPADSQVINPAVYRPTSDADLVRALETLTPIK